MKLSQRSINTTQPEDRCSFCCRLKVQISKLFEQRAKRSVRRGPRHCVVVSHRRDEEQREGEGGRQTVWFEREGKRQRVRFRTEFRKGGGWERKNETQRKTDYRNERRWEKMIQDVWVFFLVCQMLRNVEWVQSEKPRMEDSLMRKGLINVGTSVFSLNHWLTFI